MGCGQSQQERKPAKGPAAPPLTTEAKAMATREGSGARGVNTNTNTTVNIVSASEDELRQLLGAAVIRGRVPSDKEQLQQLKAKHAWLPGREQIRPAPAMHERKMLHMDKLRRRYRSEADFVLEDVFAFAPSKHDGDGLLHVDKARVAARGQSKRFVRQLFPYAVDKHTKHFVLWYLEPPANDDEVNADVAESITKYNSRGASAPFAWYENPKMTVPEVYHVQVFWHFPPS